MATPILLLQDIHLTFGGTPLLEGADLSVEPGARVCLVGRNGCGKSTLLKIAAGRIEPDSGRYFLQPGTTVQYLEQEPDFAGFETTRAYVEASLGPTDDPYTALRVLEKLGLTGEESPATLSGGEARRAALARALAPRPDILLLDEPTNHLDLPAIEWLERELRSSNSAMVIISHDRRFLETLSRATVWLDRGTTRSTDRGFGGFEEWRDKVLEEEERDLHKLDRKIAMEEDWLRYGVTARRKRNQRRLGNLHDLRKARREHRHAPDTARMAVAESEISGKLVIETKTITKAFGDRTVVEPFSVRIQRGDRIGIIGPNGAGKTTLLKMLIGDLAPDSGWVKLGMNLDVASLDQRRARLDPETSLRATLTGGGSDTVMVDGKPRHVMSYMKDFLFTPEQAGSPVSALSGGERGRLMLALAFARPSNLLVLDEPTNDLDLETLDLLQELIADYSGTVLLVSHDRDFLDRTVTSVIASEGDGRWLTYAGGYSDMIAQRGKAEETSEPKASASKPARSRDQADRQPDRAQPKRRLSFKDKHALETLPARMEALHAEIAAARQALSDPDLYARDPKTFADTSDKLTRAEADLAAAEEQWLELEILREEIESA
ncbi:ABC-F family ATP-binding cassette domain-containing protein [Microbaculum marinisediminis]|uniref:ATP-binding protein Uup n=1 Tax=Microbaculum marinisediminis TaxID=2931392 RepID=A0AAW5R181_9HYPH|nr:ATP-binding cassette domain-containing protein [Microbaculum sp. A6E488]MCT8973584.1 ATP-binding cassette domain-containing protein [Microbaculum sp. A6E488]